MSAFAALRLDESDEEEEGEGGADEQGEAEVGSAVRARCRRRPSPAATRARCCLITVTPHPRAARAPTKAKAGHATKPRHAALSGGAARLPPRAAAPRPPACLPARVAPCLTDVHDWPQEHAQGKAPSEAAGGAEDEPWGGRARPVTREQASRAVGEAAGAFMRQVAAALEAPSAHALPWRERATADAAHAGLANVNNSCFLNAVLQALVALAPVRALLQALRDARAPPSLLLESAPVCAAFLDFMADLPATNAHAHGGWVRVGARASGEESSERRSSGRRGRKEGGSGFGFGGGAQLPPTLRPRSFDESLAKFRAGFGSSQQDAQELLTFLLDGLHSELAALQAGTQPDRPQAAADGGGGGGGQSAAGDGDGGNAQRGEGGRDDCGWEEVGSKGRSLGETRRVGGDVVADNGGGAVGSKAAFTSAVAAILQGELLSTIRTQGAKASTTVQPFTLLTLDVPEAGAATIEAMVVASAESEEIEYRVEGAAHPTVANKSVTLRALPPVLVLHLNRFAFGALGGAKRSAPVRLPAELRPPAAALSSGKKGQRAAGVYELKAVVCHRGSSLGSGHYVADVRTTHGGWLRCDDARIDEVPQAKVLAEDAAQAYLLFYERR